MFAFWLSLAIPVVGVLVVPWFRRRATALALVDGFVMLAIGGVVLLHLLPFAFAQVGAVAFVLAVAGALFPWLLERRTSSSAGDRVLTLFAVLGIALHTFFDGAALAVAGDAQGDASLGLAVLLHRLPVGLMIGLLLGGPRSWRAWLGVGWVLAGTVVGYVVGEASLPSLGLSAVGAYQAFFAGTLAHVIYAHAPHVSHEHGPSPSEERKRVGLFGGVGALLGILVLLMLNATEDAAHSAEAGHHHLGVGKIFLELALESAPALLLAFAGAGLIVSFITASHMRHLHRGSRGGQAFRGMVIGLPMPICSCGVLPVYDGLIRRGAPPAAAMAFLVATPELGLDAILISVPLLGPVMTVVRLVAAALIAWAVAMLVSRGVARHPVPTAAGDAEALPPPVGARLRRALHYGFVEQSDHLLPWIVVGLGIAAWAAPLLEHAGLADLDTWIQVPLGALIGLPVYVCASGSTPLAAVLMANGLSPGAALAFLITGPATNITTFGVLSKLHGSRTALRFALAILVASVIAGWVANGFFLGSIAVPDLSSEAHGSHVLGWICLAALALCASASLLRVGPRGWLLQLGIGHSHDHDGHGDDGHGDDGHEHSGPGGEGNRRSDDCCD